MEEEVQETVKLKIGELLVKSNLITRNQLMEVLEIQKSSNKKIGEILIEENYISEQEFKEFLAIQKGYKQINLVKISSEIDVNASNLLTREYALKTKVFAFKFEADRLAIATLDPLDIYLNDEIRMLTSYEVDPYISTKKDIESAIKTYMSDEYSLQEVEEITKDIDFSIDEEIDEEIGVQKNPLVRLANQIVLKAITMRASDIHVEPQEKFCVIRFRIDGILQEIKKVPKTVQRLLRKLCPFCKEVVDISEMILPEEINRIIAGNTVYMKKGCQRCNKSGYMGRIGIFSIMVVTAEIRKMILEKAGSDEIEAVAKKDGMKTLIEVAAEKVSEGITSFEEMYRVVF
ncbi:MAG TPA: ATPase, T2SS/T4P/T4SS family [Candidatus Humimicrobiaceae bacterium]